MQKTEKVIKGLNACGWMNQNRQYCAEQECPYIDRQRDGDCVGRLHRDAARLIRKQVKAEQ